MRAAGVPSAATVASVMAEGSMGWAASASAYQAAKIGQGVAGAAPASGPRRSLGIIKRKKKCPAEESFGVAQSPNFIIQRDNCDDSHFNFDCKHKTEKNQK
jgi:hypothetical protein